MKRILWFIPNMVQLTLIAAWTTFWVLMAMLVAACARGSLLPLRMARTIWAPFVLRTMLSPVTVRGEGPLDLSRTVLFVSNHEAALDIPVLFHSLDTPLRFLAKRELFELPVIGWYLRATGMVPIDRANRDRALRSLDAARALVDRGGSIVAFPEGTRNHGGPIKPFKRGPFVFAIQNGLPIVPVAIKGTGRVLHRTSVLAIPGPITVLTGTPIETKSMTIDDRARLAAQVEAAVRRLHARDDQPRR